MLPWIVRNEHLNFSHRVFSKALLPPEIPQPVWNRSSSASPNVTQPLSGKWSARLYALEICLAFLGIWNKQRTNCAPQKWEKKGIVWCSELWLHLLISNLTQCSHSGFICGKLLYFSGRLRITLFWCESAFYSNRLFCCFLEVYFCWEFCILFI